MTELTFTEQLHHVVQEAGLAPSVHNTQPWRFATLPDGLELHADPARRLAVLDPDGRQLHLSCGAALFHARVAARGLGLDVQVRLLPDPERPQLLAVLRLSPGAPASPDDIALTTAVLHRHTYRGTFAGDPVPQPLVDRLRATAEAEGAILAEVARRDQLIELSVLLSHANQTEEQDKSYLAELSRWVHTDDSALDGLPVEPAAQSAPGSSLRQRDFTMGHPENTGGTAPTPDRPLVLVLATPADDELSWLRAGQALAAVLLRAAEQDVQAQPLGQVTDVPAYRARLRTILGLVAVPQLVLRMGTTTSATAATPRRDVEDVLAPVTG